MNNIKLMLIKKGLFAILALGAMILSLNIMDGGFSGAVNEKDFAVEKTAKGVYDTMEKNNEKFLTSQQEFQNRKESNDIQRNEMNAEYQRKKASYEASVQANREALQKIDDDYNRGNSIREKVENANKNCK